MKAKKKQRKYSKLREWIMRLVGMHSPHDEWVNIYDLDGKYTIPSLCVFRKHHGSKETEKVTGCKYHLPVCRKCRKCPAWSEARCFAEIGKYMQQGYSAALSTDLESAKKQMQELSSDVAAKIEKEEERHNAN